MPFHLTFADFQAGLPPIGLLRPAGVRELRSQISSNEGEGESEGAEVDDEGDGNVWQMYITVSEPATSNVENGSKRQRVGETQAGGVSTGREAQAEEGEDLDMRVDCVFFSDWVLTGGPERISSVLADIVGRWKAEGKFPGPLAGTLILPPTNIPPFCSSCPATYFLAIPLISIMKLITQAGETSNTNSTTRPHPPLRHSSPVHHPG